MIDRDELLKKVLRMEQGWHSIVKSSAYPLLPSVAKGRYAAAKEFHDWLHEGHSILWAQAYLDGRTQHWAKELTGIEDRMKAGPLSPEERTQLHYQHTQCLASRVELWHLARLLEEK